MSSSVAELKQQGNELMQKGEAKQAAVAFTKALQLEPSNAILLSNRSAAFLKMGRASRALQDADECVAAAPDWIKGHYRRLQAQLALAAPPADLLATALTALKLEPAAAEFLAIVKKHDAALYKTLAPPAPVTAAAPVAAAAAAVTSKDAFDLPPVVLEFARKTVDEVLQQFDENVVAKGVKAADAKLQSTAFFLPLLDVPLPVVAIDQAFSSPEMLAQCVQFLRDAAQRDQVVGACVVVQRSTVAFPQVWRGRDRRDFPFDESVDGIFITIESATIEENGVEQAGRRIVHFMPLLVDSATGVPRISREQVVALDPDWCALMPRLLK